MVSRLFTSASLPVVGGLGALYLPAPLHWLPLLGGAALGAAVLMRRPKAVVLKIGSLTWTKEELCRHVLITGDTGSGKTTSGLQTILVEVTKRVPGWGGLVLGVKGDEHLFISDLLTASDRGKDHIDVRVRPDGASTRWRPPHRFNLLGDKSIPWMTHAKAIVDIAASMTEGKQSAFFRPMAQIALARAFELLDALILPVTISRAYEILTVRTTVADAIAKLKREHPGKQELADFFDSTFLNAKAYEQREAVEGTIKTYLGFFLDTDVAAVFSSDEPDTFSLEEIDQGAVITLTMPQRLFSERRYIQTYLKVLFYFHALRRYDKPPAERSQDNLLMLVADEFQDLITASEDGISDHKVVDRIRGANTAIIAGMQSELSADPAVGIAKREVFMLNIRTRLIFRAADIKGAIASANFLGKRTIWKRSHSSKFLDSVTTSRHQEEEYFLKPEKLMGLRDHTAIVAHPSKRYTKIRIRPIDGFGSVYGWYKTRFFQP